MKEKRFFVMYNECGDYEHLEQECPTFMEARACLDDWVKRNNLAEGEYVYKICSILEAAGCDGSKLDLKQPEIILSEWKWGS